MESKILDYGKSSLLLGGLAWYIEGKLKIEECHDDNLTTVQPEEIESPDRWKGVIDNAIRMEIAKNKLKISQVYVKVFYGRRIISKFAKMAFGNFFFIFIEWLKYRLGIKT